MAVMLTVDEIGARVLAYNREADLDLVARAYRFAEGAHRGQLRHSGEPYFSHPLAVVEILLGLELDVPTLCAALLHDTVEDTPTSLNDLRHRFGSEVASLVDGVTKVELLAEATPSEKRATNLGKIVSAMVGDIRVALIKVADRLHNMRTLAAMGAAKQARIAAETRDLYVPIAMGLGLGAIYPELAELSYQVLHREEYDEICACFDYAHERVRARGESFAGELLQRLAPRFPGARVECRPCFAHEVARIQRSLGEPIERLAHILRVTVIVEHDDDCYPVLGILHALRPPILDRFKDYIATPRSNQYRALHSRLRGARGCTIRVRILSVAMDQVARRGVTYQWAYKRGADEPPAAFARRMQWLHELQEAQKAMLTSDEFLEMARDTLASDRIHPVTPRGDVLNLPRGATLLDFACAIHTDLAYHCAGGRVDGRRVERDHVLRTGDQVEILTEAMIEPAPSWLTFVRTPHARRLLREQMRSRQRERTIAIGRDRLRAIPALAGVADGARASCPAAQAAARRLGLANVDALLARLGAGRLSMGELRAAMGEQGGEEKVGEAAAACLLLGEANTRLYHLAHCCHPLAGDDVIAFFSQRDGIIVHRRICHHAVRRAVDVDEVVPVRWQSEAALGGQVGMVVEMRNEPGALATVCSRIGEQGGNILCTRTLGVGHRFGSAHFDLEVRNLNHLVRLLDALRGETVVVSAERV